jgi:hypothetical protein
VWTVTRSGPGKYILRESGFWGGGFDSDTRDPLDYPVTGFNTYSQFEGIGLTRVYTKN